jgi:transposase
MARRRRIRYSPEFKAEAVRIVQTTATPLKVVARKLGVTVTSLRDWVHAGRPAPADPLIEDERSELQRLRREDQQLRMERDSLKKLRPSSPARRRSVPGRWPSPAHAAVGDYIERFYNPVRLHSTLRCQSPVRFEARA